MKKMLIIFFLMSQFLLSINDQREQSFVTFDHPKVAFITAIYGSYEATCKPYVAQTIPADFICFSNLDKLRSNGWIIDKNPYHITHPSKLDNPAYINSLKNNTHTFNIAKYYKQAFQNIPRLKDYDVVVWLDGTMQITSSNVAQWILDKIKKEPIIGWEHTLRDGKLKSEVKTSHFERYTSTFWFGQKQPYQNVDAQYAAYLKDGYNDVDYWSKISTSLYMGLWVTSFVAFDNKNLKVSEFLDLWYLQTLQYTTQDQIGFPYVVQKLSMHPYTLPDKEISGSWAKSDFFVKHDHGR